MKLSKNQEEQINKTSLVPNNIRNLAIIAHVDHGKTTLTDSLLSEASLLNEEKAGKELYTDFDVEEKQRGITINSCNISFNYSYQNEDYLFNLADTPGHADFSGEVVRILNGVDGVLLLVDAVEGIMPQTEVVIKHSLNQKNKMILVLNKIDRLINELGMGVDKIRDVLVVLIERINTYIGNICSKEDFENYANFDLKTYNVILSSGLEKWGVSYPILIKAGLKFSDFLNNFKDSSFKKKFPLGKTVFQSVIKVIPSPVKAGLIKESYKALIERPSDSRSSLIVVGILHDKFLGTLVVTRILEGKITKNYEIYNYRMNKTEKISKVYLIMADTKIEIPEGNLGNIVGLTGISDVKIGDILSTDSTLDVNITSKKTEPSISLAIKVKDKKDENKLGIAITKLLKSDLNFSSRFDEETGQHIIGGIGELHLETTINKIKNHFGVELICSSPEIHYLETITQKGTSFEEISSNRHNRFKCFVFPLPEALIQILKEGKSFSTGDLMNAGVDKDIAKGFEKRFDTNLYFNCSKSITYYQEIRDSYYKSIESAFKRGPFAGKMVSNIGLVLEDTRIHEDPLHRGIAQILPMVRNSISESYKTAKPVILEPYNEVSLFFPQQFLNKVQHCILKRRGKIESQEFSDTYLSLRTLVPCRELVGLNQDLMDSTEGRINWSQVFEDFHQSPSNISLEIISDGQKKK